MTVLHVCQVASPFIDKLVGAWFRLARWKGLSRMTHADTGTIIGWKIVIAHTNTSVGRELELYSY